MLGQFLERVMTLEFLIDATEMKAGVASEKLILLLTLTVLVKPIRNFVERRNLSFKITKYGIWNLTMKKNDFFIHINISIIIGFL
jgi:hypothetical protein